MAKPGEKGFSLAMVMLVLLTTILGSMAIASRSTSGLMAARSQSSNREARDVAESGATEIISELNKERNRKLLVTPRDSWDGTNERKNPCSSLQSGSTPLSIANTPGPTTKAVGFKTADWINLTDSSRQYKLESAIVTDTSRAPLPATLTPAQKYGKVKSLIKLRVSGRIYTDGITRSTATISREYEVVPKCCQRSFGGSTFEKTTFGVDTRTCPPGTQSGLGLILGLNGTEPKNSQSIKLFNPEGNQIYSALCSKNMQTCKTQINLTNASGGNQPIIAYATDFSTPIPTLPLTLPRGILNAANGAYIVGKDDDVVQCTGTTCTSIVNESNQKICGKLNDQYYCKLSKIDNINSQNNLTFNTSKGAINLFFDEPTPADNYKYLNLTAGGTINHVYCGINIPETSCTTVATLNQADKLNIFISGQTLDPKKPASLDIRGSQAALALNIFNLHGNTIFLGGGGSDTNNPNFLGRIWTNGLTMNGGSIRIKVPESLPSQFCPAISDCPIGTGESPDVDFIARSITQSSNF